LKPGGSSSPSHLTAAGSRTSTPSAPGRLRSRPMPETLLISVLVKAT
jgi:hypothetical protein